MKIMTPVAVLAEQRPGFLGYAAGFAKGQRKEAELFRLFSKLEKGRKKYIVISGGERIPPYLKRTSRKFGAEILSGASLPEALRAGGYACAAVVSQRNEFVSGSMIDRMAGRLALGGAAHVYFKPDGVVPYNAGEAHAATPAFLEKYGLRRLDRAKGLPYELGIDDKRWLFGEVAKRSSKSPRLVAIEPTNLCNLKCSMCPVHSSPEGKSRRRPGFMDFGLYKNIIRQLPERSKVNLVLHGYGEPLLHPKIADMVSFAKKSGINDVQFATNGLLLTREKSKGLIDSGLDRLDVSLDGYLRKEYESIRIGADFKAVKENIFEFLRLRGNKEKPALNIRIVKQGGNVKSLGKFIKYWTEAADTVTVDERHDEGSVKRGALGRFPCPALRLLMEIYWDGTVVLCNMDAFAKNKLGDLKREKLLDIWNGGKLNRIRELHNKLVFNKPAICDKCGWWQCFDTWQNCDSKGLSCMKNPVTAVWKKRKTGK